MTDLTQIEFSTWLADMRPRLHRYCARMVGSVFDGEDVVQEALAKAAEAYPAASPIERPDSWLLRIAHNTALDAIRRSKRAAAFHSDVELPDAVDERESADARVAATASLAALLQLPPVQRSSVVLMDVLGHSLAETASIIDATVPAVKAALHRGRAKLQTSSEIDVPVLDEDERARLRDYADRFNARDFDALRALLAEDVRLDLVNRTRLAGRKDVAVYFTRYSELPDFHVTLGVAEGRSVLLVRKPRDAAVAYPILLTWRDGSIAAIRDFHYATYVADSLAVS
ncbi:sigma-70 family RNA polymerase sigma factor [Roseiterribacter gracilis]|uniref:DNA-directed RNA polymerase sigma-70 factor n=1 Tax=Roseiterribacter gracilis TaxID=2812848 RepID=A0A8S8XIA7_9PROT|nr:DNA-directed RNA polymerase sigma-70 factor [Rhodospirillales bacterium TMPK1]